MRRDFALKVPVLSFVRLFPTSEHGFLTGLERGEASLGSGTYGGAHDGESSLEPINMRKLSTEYRRPTGIFQVALYVK